MLSPEILARVVFHYLSVAASVITGLSMIRLSSRARQVFVVGVCVTLLRHAYEVALLLIGSKNYFFGFDNVNRPGFSGGSDSWPLDLRRVSGETHVEDIA